MQPPTNISKLLDEKAGDVTDLSHLDLPHVQPFAQPPDETIFFAEFNPCSMFCDGNHPFSTVERYGHWYYCHGQDRKAGIHSSRMRWHMFTRDKALALKIAKAHLQ